MMGFLGRKWRFVAAFEEKQQKARQKAALRAALLATSREDEKAPKSRKNASGDASDIGGEVGQIRWTPTADITRSQKAPKSDMNIKERHRTIDGCSATRKNNIEFQHAMVAVRVPNGFGD
jgi:hypothetical protein